MDVQLFSFTITLSWAVQVLQACEDRTPLGLRNGLIRDDQISASSIYQNEPDYQPYFARLNNPYRWCSGPNEAVEKEYLQISFNDMTTLTGIALEDPNTFSGLVEKFNINYTTIDGAPQDKDFKYAYSFDGWRNDPTNSNKEKPIYRWFNEPLAVRSVRIYSLSVLNTSRVMCKNVVCLRVELYGCTPHKDLLPLGMESRIIKNDDISGSGFIESSQDNARLFYPGDGLCVVDSTTDLYLQVNFSKLITVNAVAMQGDIATYKFNRLTYGLRFDNGTRGGYNSSDNGLVPKIVKLKPAATGKSFKFTKKSCSNPGKCCMKVELYGHRSVCYTSLREYSDLQVPDIDNKTSYCIKNDEVVIATFNKHIIVSGIVLQGDSEKNGWITKFALSYENSKDQKPLTKINTEYMGTSDRIAPLAVNWLDYPVLTKKLLLRPKSCDPSNPYECCFRLDIRGCELFNFNPVKINLLTGEDLVLQWEQPENYVSTVNAELKYNITIKARKPYNSTYLYRTSSDQTDLKYNLSEKIFGGIMNITLESYISQFPELTEVSRKTFTIQPSAPGPVRTATSTLSNGSILEIFQSDDLFGPISLYQIFVSEVNETADINKPFLYQRYNSSNSMYHLAAKVGTNETFPLQYIFINSEEEVKGLSGQFDTIGNYYLHIRAVILGEDIEKYGFDNKDYYGEFQTIEITRQSLKQTSEVTFTSKGYPVVKIPVNNAIETYQVLLIKENSTIPLKDPASYFESNKHNDVEPQREVFVLANLTKTDVQANDAFVIDPSMTQTKQSKRKRRSNSQMNFLVPNEEYRVAVRGFNSKDQVFYSPWSESFVARSPTQTTPQTTDVVEPGTNKNDEDSPDFPLTETIAGIAVVSAIFLVIFVVLMVRRKRKSKKEQPYPLKKVVSLDELTESDKKKPLSVNGVKLQNGIFTHNGNVTGNNHVKDESYQSSPRNNDEIIYANINNNEESPYPPIPVHKFPEYYLKQKDDMFLELIRQFNEVPMGSVMKTCTGKLAINKTKNRYLNIVPFDHTRVKLPIPNIEKENDYINGSYIRGPYKEKTYISTQAPKSETISDFWHMVYFQESPLIIMLTNLREEGKVKCTQYWPSEKEETYKDVTISLKDEKQFPDFIKRELQVKYQEKLHNVTQLHFTSWPDFGCPEYPTVLLNFCQKVRNEFPYSLERPIIVHCSAGVGRSGTYILIDAMLQMIAQEKKVDIYNYFEILRQDRMQMVQTAEQYLFVYGAIYEFICCGNTSIDSSKFTVNLRQALKHQVDGKSQLNKEFEKQHEILPSFNKSHYVNATLQDNVSKNRNPDILARDTDRVILINNNVGINYINAVYVNGYKNKNAFVATQVPLEHTLAEYWLMVFESNIQTIVWVHGKDEIEELPEFLPSSSSLVREGKMEVELLSYVENGGINEKKIWLSQGEKAIEIDVFVFDSWKDKAAPKEYDVIIKLIDNVIRSQQNQHNGKVLVTCSDGGNRSGTFIACMNALDQVKIEQATDIFQIVRRLKLVRPQFVETLIQYEYVYRLTDYYIRRFSSYSNFS